MKHGFINSIKWFLFCKSTDERNSQKRNEIMRMVLYWKPQMLTIAFHHITDTTAVKWRILLFKIPVMAIDLLAVTRFVGCLVAIAILLLNGVFLIALVKKKSLHVPSNVLLGFLSTMDFLSGLFTLPLIIMLLLSSFLHSDLQNVAFTFFNIFFSIYGLSAQFLAIISLDRFVAICHPFAYVKYATCKLHLSIAFSVLFVNSVVIAVGSVLQDMLDFHFHGAFATISLVAALPLLTFCNWKIFRVLRKKNTEVASVGGQQGGIQTETKKFHIVFTVVVLFLVCNVPFVILFASIWLKTVVPAIQIGLYVTITLFLSILNSLVNPIVYYFRMRSFRAAMKEVLRCFWIPTVTLSYTISFH